MALTLVSSSRAYPVGALKVQHCEYTTASGDTTGTLTAPSIAELIFCIAGGSGMTYTALPTYSANVATFAFSTQTSTKATLVTQGLTMTAVASDNTGNLISVAFTGGGTAGAEVVTVVGNAISVKIQSGVSTVTQVRTAMQAAAACTALVVTTGTSSSTVSTASALFLTGGITGGGAGSIAFYGR